MTPSLSTLLLAIVALPLAGAIATGLFGKRLPNSLVGFIACGTTGVSFLLALITFSKLLRTPLEQIHDLSFNYFRWIQVDNFVANFGFMLDQLTGVMLLVVTGVGFLIHIYSTGYMASEGGYYRFFAYLNLFMFSMLILILANNFLLMFVGWEGVGLCSYLLIGFYFLKKSACDAGKKAFVVNRVGDFGFTLALLLIFWTFGTIDFRAVFARAASFPVEGFASGGTLTTICILLFIGATGKSAQLPLYVWLPDAMEGPTPVSALIHAATMVTAGVYMVARCNALFVLAPKAMMLVAVVGALTAIFAASIGLVQNDIKRVLAYSTVSQLGYMFLGCGVGAFAAGIFHLMTHAFFKALLFLGSGSVIHALSGEQDLRRMGGLKEKIPLTWGTMLVGTIAIAGFPPLAGFFSKDEILWQAYASPRGHWLLWLVGVVGAGMTSFYMFRMMFLTFHGQSRMAADVEHHVHESPRSMTVPLVVLAAGSVVAGWVGIPHVMGQYLGHPPNAFERFLEPVFEHPLKSEAGHGTEGLEGGLMLGSVGIGLVGLLVARTFYLKNPALPEKLKTRFRALYITLLNKYWVDEIYDDVIIKPVKIISTYILWKFRGAGGVFRKLQSGYTRSYAGWILVGAVFIIVYISFS
ncbi:MAG: NADH-quinone oxidoreductase subunit L [Acidobacteria bacterium]|nr:MAG: NADH-quinone oxidoreductase subunit L [Acidobacteriota bacterium]